jgi:hypothetical protein
MDSTTEAGAGAPSRLLGPGMVTTAFTLDGYRIARTIGVRYDITEIMQGVTELLCYGTAVEVVRQS